MLSAHQPLAAFPEIIKQALKEAAATAQFSGGVSVVCDGALYPEAIPAALEALKARIKLESNDEDLAQIEDSDRVGIHTRAFPLFELMQSAIEKTETLMWDKG